MKPKYFLPQATFTYCIFNGFDAGVIFALKESKVFIDYSTFINNHVSLNASILYARDKAKIKIHHSNIDDTNQNPKFKFEPNEDTIVDARWNYWQNDIPSENIQTKISPRYVKCRCQDF